MLVVGITGRARSGKNVAANAISVAAASKDFTVKIYEFSDYVLRDLKAHDLIDQRAERETLTWFGIHQLVEHGLYVRNKNPFYWVDELFSDAKRDNPDVAILPNVRFQNEADTIRNYADGVIIRVKALTKNGTEWISTDRDPNDEMETENQLILADYFLTVKKGQTTLLSQQAKTLFEYILKERKN